MQSSDLMSLDDIIKKSRNTKGPIRGKGPRQGITRNGPKPNGAPAGRPKPLGRVEDARFKIIQKKRTHITDARDKLAQIAKQSDARLKLQKLRGANAPKKFDSSRNTSRKPIRNGRASLSSKYLSPQGSQSMSRMQMAPPSKILTYTAPTQIMPEAQFVTQMLMNYAGDYILNRDSGLKRTVSNDYTPSVQRPSVFRNDNVQYSWDNPLPQSSSSLSRGPPMRSSDHGSRPRDYKVIPRTGMTLKPETSPYKEKSAYSFGSKSRTILSESSAESKYYSPMRSQRDSGVKSRLDSIGSRSRNAVSSSSRPKPTNSQSAGFRIVVSNLQANVTQEDIKELFEDVGELLISRLVRPGIAEVVYKTLKDASKAVETYHNRQLDGHPMKCLLVNPRPKTSAPSSSSSRILSHARGGYSQSNLGAVHRALFN